MGTSSTSGGTRAALLTAARSRFATVGFDACRLADLCADASLTTGALYRNFASKDALLATLLDHLDADLDTIDPDRPLDELIDAWLVVIRRHRGAFRASIEQSLTRGEGTERRHQQRARLVDLLAGALTRHRHAEVAASLAADTLEYLALGEILGWVPTRDPAAVATTLARLLHDGVEPAADEPQGERAPVPNRRGPRMTPVLSWAPGPSRANPTTARGTEQVATILAAATEVFGAVGVGQATIEDIAARAGVASGTVYRYFTDKVDVLACLAVRVEQALYASAVLPTDEHGRFAPRDAALAYLHTRREHLGVFRAWREVALTAGTLGDAWVAMHREFSRGIEVTLVEGQARGVASRHLDPALVGDLVVAMFEQPAHSRIELGLDPEVPDDQVATVLTAVLGRGLATGR